MDKKKLNPSVSEVFNPDRHLYLIHNEVNNTLKFGASKNVKKRLSSIQSANCCEIKLLFVVDGGGDFELSLMEFFEHLNIRGEWYKYDVSIINYFKMLTDGNR